MLSYLETDGIDVLKDDSQQNRDSDGYKNFSINTNFGYTFDNGVDVGLSFLESHSRIYLRWIMHMPDHGTEPFSDSTIQNIGFSVSAPFKRLVAI